MNLTRVQIQQVQKPQVPYFTYEPPRRFISKINNLRFASSRDQIKILPWFHLQCGHVTVICLHKSNKPSTMEAQGLKLGP